MPISQMAARPPKHLQKPGRTFWKQIADEYVLENHARAILDCACTALDRMTEAREKIVEHGLTYADDKGGIHPRPEIAIERDSRIAFLRALRELSLDVDVPEAARPPLIPNRYKLTGA